VTSLIALATLPREGPSVRPRVLAYEGALSAAGIDLDFRPFLTSRGFRGFYSTNPVARGRKVILSALGFLRRRRDLADAAGAPGILVHREIVPVGNPRALARLAAAETRILYDLDDAIYLAPRDFVAEGEVSRRRMTRLKDPREVDGLLAAAAIVLAGNETLAEHAREFCDDVRVQPTPVDTAIYRPRPREPRERPLVGWIGSPTAAYCIRDIAPALSRAAREVPFDLLVVGAGEPVVVDGVRVIDTPWTLEREAELFSSLDVGLYPIPDNEWTRGKCGMKALQYQASGVPPIVSPVGVNRRIVDPGRTGFFAENEDEWTARLIEYLGAPGLRAVHAEAGLQSVTRTWSQEALTPSFVAAVRDILA
jgi:glycosyltransferase involved in cell wall biosynthesis